MYFFLMIFYGYKNYFRKIQMWKHLPSYFGILMITYEEKVNTSEIIILSWYYFFITAIWAFPITKLKYDYIFLPWCVKLSPVRTTWLVYLVLTVIMNCNVTTMCQRQYKVWPGTRRQPANTTSQSERILIICTITTDMILMIIMIIEVLY